VNVGLTGLQGGPGRLLGADTLQLLHGCK
jgi:hypothetical protein